jgi:hypothetical protein
MQLILDPLDLKSEKHCISMQDVTFNDLKEDVQLAIEIVGVAVIYNWDKSSYNRIHFQQDI